LQPPLVLMLICCAWCFTVYRTNQDKSHKYFWQS